MKRTVFIAVMAATAAWAQTQPPPPARPMSPEEAAKAAFEKAHQTSGTPPPTTPAPPTVTAEEISILAMPSDVVVATVDGLPVTAGEVQALVQTMPQQLQQQIVKDRRQFLQQYGMLRRFSAQAEKAKLFDVSPWREVLKNTRTQVMAQAWINQYISEMVVAPEQLQKFYDSNKDRFAESRVKAIYLPFSGTPPGISEAEARAKAADLVKQARAGADFSKLAKENSGDPVSAAKDGDFGTVTKTTALSAAMRDAIFNAKTGEVTEPVRQPNGFYVFKVEETGAQPLEKVRDSIANELRNARVVEWMTSVQSSIDVQMAGQPSATPSQPPPAAAPAK